ncbi:MAG: histidine kinase dimerization/phospho-acceptor domain-containing protein [Pseudomonadota bacterium]|nr:histidine kinase dimerization/phospho-acceptor domain-containing protein [Pseudomonadota bacterium]MDP1906036.1 histidine kinase dimerization/phospho-acceptor domain-containing protein [Pseudomonadota bacterium]MDP2352506.1 histidine kinase dimerization/phospho-acceptor domain-containing protein [Pseudomonadota bacterium]
MITTLFLAVLALGCLTALASGNVPWNLPEAVPWLILAASILALLTGQLAERLAMRRLTRGVLNAREGLLDPISPGLLGWTAAGRALGEYNITIHALQTMFRTVEECQGRFLNQRNKMNTILQSLPAALLSLSDDLQIILTNKHAEDIFAVTGRGLIGTNLFELIQLRERDRELLRDAFLYKQVIQNQEISLDLGGRLRYFSLNLGFYSDEDADMAGVLILQDISEYRDLQTSIAMREKLVAMGQLAAGVAHELNTPLGSIHGYAQLLSRTTGSHEKLGEYASIIADEARRCSRIVQDLLNYARDEPCSGETCEVNQLVHDLIETFLNCRMRRYKIEIKLDLTETALLVEGSCGQLDIVLNNLVTNAIHALDGIANPTIVIDSQIEDTYAVISVADNGPGVPPEARSRIFDPFFTTKQVGQGSGLGLAISQAILAKRDGYIVYDSEYTEGARFRIKLPMVDLRRAGL